MHDSLPKDSIPFILILMCLSAIPAQAQTQSSSCNAERLSSGVSYYEMGLFDRVINTLESCLPEGFIAKDNQVAAHRLVVLSYLENEDEGNARKWTEQLLEIDGGFTPSSEDPLRFSNLVEEYRPKKWHQKWGWRMAIGAGTAGLTTAAIFLFQEGDPQALKGPPQIPQPPDR